MRSVRSLHRHASCHACFVLYMINHSVLVSTTSDSVPPPPTLATHDDALSEGWTTVFIQPSTTTQRPQTTPVVIGNDDALVHINGSSVLETDTVFALSNTADAFEVAILVQGSASMRLKADDLETYDNAILQWHAYCKEYVEDVWKASGEGAMPLVLSFDWVQIDDTRLDVFFVGIYPLDAVSAVPACLSSAQTLHNANTATDVCSRLTLGEFGQKLLSGSQARLLVTTAHNITAMPQHRTHNQVVQSVRMNRLSIGASFTETRQIAAFMQTHALANIFDNFVIVSSIPSVTPVVNVVFEPDPQPIM